MRTEEDIRRELDRTKRYLIEDTPASHMKPWAMVQKSIAPSSAAVQRAMILALEWVLQGSDD